MDMQRINSGKLRAIGYDARQRAARRVRRRQRAQYLGVGDESGGACPPRVRPGATSATTSRKSLHQPPRRSATVGRAVKADPLADLFAR